MKTLKLICEHSYPKKVDMWTHIFIYKVSSYTSYVYLDNLSMPSDGKGKREFRVFRVKFELFGNPLMTSNSRLFFPKLF